MTPTLSDDALLLAAVRAAPDDDAPRLVYADWLDEHGRHEQAEFVRVQIELARPPEADWLPSPDHLSKYTADQIRQLYDLNNWRPSHRIAALRERERALWNTVISGWLKTPEWSDWTFHWEPRSVNAQTPPVAIVRRGFVDEVRVSVAALCGPCPSCDRGVQWRSMPPESRVCEDCGGDPETNKPGTGRTGIAAQLARLPLTHVRVTDREPREAMDGEVSQWRWVDALEFGLTLSHRLPSELFALLPRDPSDIRGLVTMYSYTTRQSAIDALDTAALLHIRGMNPEAAPTRSTTHE